MRVIDDRSSDLVSVCPYCPTRPDLHRLTQHALTHCSDFRKYSKKKSWYLTTVVKHWYPIFRILLSSEVKLIKTFNLFYAFLFIYFICFIF